MKQKNICKGQSNDKTTLELIQTKNLLPQEAKKQTKKIQITSDKNFQSCHSWYEM